MSNNDRLRKHKAGCVLDANHNGACRKHFGMLREIQQGLEDGSIPIPSAVREQYEKEGHL